MKSLKGVFVLGLIAVIVLVVMGTFTLAESNAANSTNPYPGVNISARCNEINNRVDGRIRQYEEGRDRHLIEFNNMRDRINDSIERLNRKGFDTTNITNDLLILDGKISKLRQDYALFIQKLNETKGFTCGHSNGDFFNALNASKAQLRIVRLDVEDIKNFYRDTIRKDITELRLDRLNEREARLENRSEGLENRTGGIENRTQILENRTGWTQNRTQEIKDRIEQLKNRSEGLRNRTEYLRNRTVG